MFCYQRNFINPTQPVDEAQFAALVKGKQWAELIDKFRETGDASLKRKLPAFIFQANFEETTSKAGKVGRWRKQAATLLTGLVVMDIDHLEEDARGLFEKWQKEQPQLFDAQSPSILLVYITPSGKGLKVVFKARMEWGNLIDNQHEMAKLLNVTVDESCKDASRMSFICKESDILFLNKELFTYDDKEYGEKFNEKYREGKNRGKDQNNAHPSGLPDSPPALPKGRGQNVVKSSKPSSFPSEYHGIKWEAILKKYWEVNNRGFEPTTGDRDTLTYQLACDLRHICGKDFDWLDAVIPCYDGFPLEEKRQKIRNALNSPLEGFPPRLRNTLNALEREAVANGAQGASTKKEDGAADGPKDDGESLTETLNAQLSAMNNQLNTWGLRIAALFEDFPLLRDICKGLKPNQYPAALFVGGGLLMTLMTRCSYRFYHRPEELRRLNNSTLIIGDPACGKSFATRLYKLLTGPIVDADKAGKDAINAYRELMRTKGSNKEKPKKPQVVVRIHPARTSNAQFIQDMVNAVEVVDGKPVQLHMLTFDTELDNTMTVQKGGSWIDKQSLELKAFHNEEDGQAYSNIDSILQNFNVVWNYIYTGTPIALKKKVNATNFGSGLATRLTCIPLPSTNFEMLAREENIDTESDERLKEWAAKLDKTKGELSLQRIVDELYAWTERRMDDARDNESKADELLLKRCAYHGINFAAPFIVMRHWEELQKDGEFYCGTFETDDTDWQLAELIVNMQFACQRYFFGGLANDYFDNKLKEASMVTRHQERTIEGYNRLPEEFTNEDVARCFQMGNPNSARPKIKRLIKDHLIEVVGEVKVGKFTKTKYRKTGYPLSL